MNVCVTGIGAQCALGEDTTSIWESIEKGKCGITQLDRFDVSPFNTKYGAVVDYGKMYSDEKLRLLKYGCTAACEALNNASIENRARVSLILGTCNGIIGEDVNKVSKYIAKELGLGGITLTISTACASSAQAIGIAADLIRMGISDYVLAGGVDILSKDVFAGFHTLGILSDRPCAPFSTELGTTLAEGAAFIILEKEETAKQRNVVPLAIFLGYGFSADAYHDTKPDPSGKGMARAIFCAISDANLQPGNIDYYNAHGTGTAANDASEWQAIQKVFKAHSTKLPVSSSKSFFGHAQGAAGALEVAATIMAMNNNVIPPTLNLKIKRRNAPSDPVAENKPRKLSVETVMCFNAAFGGINAALIFGKSKFALKVLSVPKKVIAIENAIKITDPTNLENYLPKAEMRGLDMSAKLLSYSVAKVLSGAGIRYRSTKSAEIGLFVGQNHLSPGSLESFEKSVEENGWGNVCAKTFTRMVVNYATGASCRLFGLKGPSMSMASEPDSGLPALVLSAYYLAHHSECKRMIPAAVDDPSKNEDYERGAASLLLNSGESDSKVVLTGWALADNYQGAIQKALNQSGYTRNEVKSVIADNNCSTSGLLSVVKIYHAINQGESGPFLVSSKDTGSQGVALVIENIKTYRNAS